MEGEGSDNAYTSIFKSVYLFLENNNLTETASVFLKEVKKKYKNVDVTEAPIRTVIFRPSDTEAASKDENVVICISANKNANIDINNDNCSCCPQHNDIDELKQTLAKLQSEHTNLIQIASQLTNAMNTMEKNQKDKLEPIFQEYKDIIPELYMYTTDNAPQNTSYVIYEASTKTGEGTDDQIESSVINSSHNSNVQINEPNIPENNENFIPLETKKVSKDIPSALKGLDDSPIAINERGAEPMDLSLAHTYTGEKRYSNNIKTVEDIMLVPTDLVCKSAHKCAAIKKANSTLDDDDLMRTYTSRDFFELEFDRIKDDLSGGDIDIKLRILQALRWRLTQTITAVRDHNLQSYVRNNILFLSTDDNDETSFLESYFVPKNCSMPHPLQEEMARFVNTLASLSSGREYLQKDVYFFENLLLPLLMGKLNNVKVFDLTREFIMATVQKMSLSSRMRKIIIASGIVEWLVSFMLRNHHFMTNYEAEYSAALLMNLCINNETIKRCEAMADKVATLLCDFTNTPHICCLPYLPGIYFTLLSNAKINETAKMCSLFNKLGKLKEKIVNEEFKTQLEIIIEMFTSGEAVGNDCTCDETDEYVNYADILEPELDMHDPIFGDPSGEKLLEIYRLVHSSIVSKPQAQALRKHCVCGSKLKLGDDIALKVPNNSFALDDIAEEIRAANSEEAINRAISGKKSPLNRSPSPTKKSSEIKTRNSETKKGFKKPISNKLNDMTTKKSQVRKSSSAITNASETVQKKRTTQSAKYETQLDTQKVDQPQKDEIRIGNESPESVPPVIMPCRLNYYYYNRLGPEIGSNEKNKYSCKCYESIKAMIDEVEMQNKTVKSSPPNIGRKSNNVVYGPFKPKLYSACTCDEGKECTEYHKEVFETRQKINRTP